jgi:hypothetical protein
MSGKPSAAILVCAAAIAFAAVPATVDDVVRTVRSALQSHRSDQELARTLLRVSPSERVDDAVIEALENEGAGPAAVEALIRLRELSLHLPQGSVQRLFESPPPPSSVEQKKAIDAARAAALQYQEGLPDFLCTQTVRRYRDPHAKEAWRPVDVLTITVSYSAQGENYKLVAQNGKPSKRSLSEMGGSHSEGEFGSLMKRVFQPSSETEFQWERWGILRRRAAHVFSYRIEAAQSHYALDYEFDGQFHHLKTAMRGRVYIDRETNQTLRITWEADGLPVEVPIRRTPAVLDYDYADVGGRRYLLPARGELRIVTVSGQTRNVIEFADYRKFTSDTNVTYEKQ